MSSKSIIMFSHLFLDFTNCPLPEILYTFLISPIHVTFTTHLMSQAGYLIMSPINTRYIGNFVVKNSIIFDIIFRRFFYVHYFIFERRNFRYEICLFVKSCTKFHTNLFVTSYALKGNVDRNITTDRIHNCDH